MKFAPVNLEKSLDLCLQFRRETHVVSYGSDCGFSPEQCTAWFRHLKKENPAGFEHIWLNGRIIGQLEYRSGITGEGGAQAGYINLIYVLPECRGKGVGAALQEHAFSRFISDGHSHAYLRYMPENRRAGSFYDKHGWSPQGIPDERGQLMVRRLF